jgi:hypothetical protein
MILDLLYVVLSRKSLSDADRPVLISRGSGRAMQGTLDISQAINMKDLPELLEALHDRAVGMEYLGELVDLPANSPFAQPTQAILAGADRACELVHGERVLGALVKACATFDWLMDEEAETYFELRTKSPLADPEGVEAAALKVYVGTALLTMIFFECTYYISLKDTEEEQPLHDTSFPDVSQRSACYYIPTMSRRGTINLSRCRIFICFFLCPTLNLNTAGEVVEEESGVAKFVLNLIPPKSVAGPEEGWFVEGDGCGWLPEGGGAWDLVDDSGVTRSDGGIQTGGGGEMSVRAVGKRKTKVDSSGCPGDSAGGAGGTGGGRSVGSRSSKQSTRKQHAAQAYDHPIGNKKMTKDVSLRGGQGGETNGPNGYVQLFCVLLVNPFATDTRSATATATRRQAMFRLGNFCYR